MHCLEARNLKLSAGQLSLDVPHLRFKQGKTCCVVGRSGSGKSLLAAALSGLPVPGMAMTGDVCLNGSPADGPLWKDHVFVLPQEPALALNPTMPVGKQLAEVFRWRGDPACSCKSPGAISAEVGLDQDDLKKIPGQLSGGMQQRIMIAMALVARASFVIADEPTKGLDGGNKKRIIDLFGRFRTSGRGLIVITHDLEVASALADDIIVLGDGLIAEQGLASQVLTNPRSEATRELIRSAPQNWPTAPATPQKPHCPVVRLEDVTFGYRRTTPILSEATMEIDGGEIVGLLGPSGSGKSTFGDLCLALQKPQSGTVQWFGSDLNSALIRKRRTKFQKLFQNPVTSFPPNLVLRDVFDKLTPQSAGANIRTELMSRLGLTDDLLLRRPDQVSGGELQRLAIIRVLLAQPSFLVCDEPSSRLDMSIQRLAIDVIAEYSSQFSSAVLLISHNETVLRKRANRVFEISHEGRLSLKSYD
ncbi:ABC transporter ATP-binding protein [Roseibium album]|uniref:ABC transporter ATP-binding protein n=1 Tax=Roseibium album TaxID=311410 RepID=UPI003BAF286B